MSVDFTVGYRDVVPLEQLKQEVAASLVRVLPSLQQCGVSIELFRAQPTHENQRVIASGCTCRMLLAGRTGVWLMYLTSADLGGGEARYVVELDTGQPPLNIVWAVTVAEAICVIGGSYIYDECFVSGRDERLACGELARALETTERGLQFWRRAQVDATNPEKGSEGL